MLENIFTTSVSETISAGGTVIILLSALLMGLLISIVYMKTHGKEEYSQSFVITMIMLPAIIAMIILLVGSNIARAFSLAGAFSLIRYRSTPGDSKDIAYIFFTLAVGLACGMGYIAYALLFAIIMCGVMIILNLTKFGKQKNTPMRIRITIPEDMNYAGLFDGVFDEYTTAYHLVKIKTTEFGSLFELVYDLNLTSKTNTKEMIDRLRCKNGNLNIILHMKESGGETL